MGTCSMQRFCSVMKEIVAPVDNSGAGSCWFFLSFSFCQNAWRHKVKAALSLSLNFWLVFSALFASLHIIFPFHMMWWWSNRRVVSRDFRGCFQMSLQSNSVITRTEILQNLLVSNCSRCLLIWRNLMCNIMKRNKPS